MCNVKSRQVQGNFSNQSAKLNNSGNIANPAGMFSSLFRVNAARCNLLRRHGCSVVAWPSKATIIHLRTCCDSPLQKCKSGGGSQEVRAFFGVKILRDMSPIITVPSFAFNPAVDILPSGNKRRFFFFFLFFFCDTTLKSSLDLLLEPSVCETTEGDREVLANCCSYEIRPGKRKSLQNLSVCQSYFSSYHHLSSMAESGIQRNSNKPSIITWFFFIH